jgi:hypothetical protein
MTSILFLVPLRITWAALVWGEPFRTRLPSCRGLSYPKVRITPSFICEACTVRAQIGEELHRSGRHLTLVMLERMRMIDQAHAWSIGSHRGYQSGLRRLSRFQSDFGVPILTATTLLSPPRSSSIGMMWAPQHYAIQTPTGRHSQNSDRILFQTARLSYDQPGHTFTLGTAKLLILIALYEILNGASCCWMVSFPVMNSVTRS